MIAFSYQGKTCPKCGESKTPEGFYANRGHRDGLSSWCRPCTTADRHRAWREKHPEPPPYVVPTEKACTRCKTLKPIDDFYRHAKTKDKRQTVCKACSNETVAAIRLADPARHAAYNREWDRKNPVRKADTQLKSRLGVPHGTYADLFARQGGQCAICGTLEPGGNGKRFAVDHSAATGAIRGLLCNNCNNGIGRFHDNPDRLRWAANYLERAPK